MESLFAAAGLAEASGASLFFLLIGCGPFVALLVVIVVGSIIAIRYEMPPEDYGESRTTKPPKPWADEV